MQKYLGTFKVRKCRPLASERSTFFTRANANKSVLEAVSLHATANDGLYPTVEELKAHATTKRPLFGLYFDFGEGGEFVGIITDGDGLSIAREENAPAVLAADIDKGVQAHATVNGAVEVGAVVASRAAIERGVITGGNTAQGTSASPGFYRINLRTG